MAQQNVTDYPIDPTTTTGTDLADRLNRQHAADASMHSGAARPAYLTAGGLWTKTLAAGSYSLMWFDGTNDHEICKSIAGVFSVAGGGNFLPLTGGTLTGNLRVQGEIDATGNVTGYKP